MADKYQGEVTASIKAWGFKPYKEQDAFYTESVQAKMARQRGDLWTPKNPGTFDMHVVYGTRIAWVELKNDYDSIPFAALDKDKRAWLEGEATLYNYSTWMYLILGTQAPHLNPEKFPYARRAWLFPARKFLEIEASFPQKSLPMLLTNRSRLNLREGNLCAINLLKEWALLWKNGCWRITPEHPFAALMQS